jgi:hypothetical protein
VKQTCTRVCGAERNRTTRVDGAERSRTASVYGAERSRITSVTNADRIDMRGSPHSAKRIMKTGWKRLAEAVCQLHMAAGVKVGGGADGQEGEMKKVAAPAAADRRAPIRQNGLSFILFVHRCACWLRPGRRQSKKILSQRRQQPHHPGGRRKQQYHSGVRGPSLNP